MRENVFFFCFVSIFSPPDICEKISFFRKKNPHFRGCVWGDKKTISKKVQRLYQGSHRVVKCQTRTDPTRHDPVTRSKTTRLNNFFMRKISHCKKKKLPFYDIMTLVFGQSLYRSIRLEIASFFFLQVLLKLMPVTNMIQAHAETQENSPGQQKIVRAHEFIFFSKKKTQICCIQHTCGVLPFLWVGSTPI